MKILQSMKQQGISHDEMAERMDVTPAVLTSMQRATNPLKVEILVKAARALDMELQVRFVTKKSKARPESSID